MRHAGAPIVSVSVSVSVSEGQVHMKTRSYLKARLAALATAACILALVPVADSHADEEPTPVPDAVLSVGDTFQINETTYLPDNTTVVDKDKSVLTVVEDPQTSELVLQDTSQPPAPARRSARSARTVRTARTAVHQRVSAAADDDGGTTVTDGTERVPADLSGKGGTSSASGCRKISINFTDKSILGRKVTMFLNWSRWCWTRSTQVVSTPTHGYDYEIYDGVISWEGYVDGNTPLFYDFSTNDGHPKSAWKNYKKAHFQQTLPFTTIDRYIGLTLRSYFNGTFAYEVDTP